MTNLLDEHIVLEAVRYQVATIINDEQLDVAVPPMEVFVERIISMHAHNIVSVITVPAEQLDHEEVDVPASWWQHTKMTRAFRGRWNPLRLVTRRWPPMHTLVVLDAKALYPSVTLPKDRHQAIVRIDRTEYPQ